ncbi:amidohydrolase [Sediminibacterium soli]|uniref:amidohydrolase n=1 Tax=Sediminibacterium soli TaxID=2698829 RepID=UPI00137A19EC|nr:amidohydrolase [Sediminibacterium soli]NCI47850.1 amidohydrolase [Sediminibacterium soli]
MSSLTLSLIQSDLQWEDKAANLSRFEQKIAAIRGRTEIVVLPEMFSTGFSMKPALLAETMDGPTVQWMQRIAAEKKIILTGSLIIAENGNYFNRLLWVLPNGTIGCYDKRHRFAFAGEDQEYTSGNKRLIASVKGWKINLQVCYDLRFPVWARQQSGETPEYDLLLYVANWPERRSHAWKTLLTARAIENQCYVAGVNRVGNDGNGIAHGGDTLVTDALGATLYHSQTGESVHTITLEKAPLEEIRQRFPFWKDADEFKILQHEE